MAGTFELKTASNGEIYFHLKAANGEKILASEMYKAKAGALNGIESVKKNAPVEARYEKLVSNNSKPYFVLKAGNGEVIGKSEMYDAEAGRDNGIESVMTNAPTATLVDSTTA
jgi:uncharacterized protein